MLLPSPFTYGGPLSGRASTKAHRAVGELVYLTVMQVVLSQTVTVLFGVQIPILRSTTDRMNTTTWSAAGIDNWWPS